MEIDEDEYVYNPENESGDQITTPGESIADFQLFMRYVSVYLFIYIQSACLTGIFLRCEEDMARTSRMIQSYRPMQVPSSE
jgi:hypothetical protein